MAKKDFLVDIDLNKNQLLNAKLQNLATPPTLSASDKGFTYFDTTDNLIKTWNGTSWVMSGGTGITNLGHSKTASDVTITSSSGTSTTIPAADTTNAGVMTKAMFDKLAGIETAADVTDAANVNSAGAVMESDYISADSILVANSAGTPVNLAVTVNSVLGRIAGSIQNITIDSDLSTTSASDDTLPSAKATKAYTDSQISGHKHYQLYKPDGSAAPVYVDAAGKLHIDGDIVQAGTTYITHTENLNTSKDIITLREGAVAGLGAGGYTGIVAKLYDGVNDGRLIFDNTGTAKVGDVGNEQALATRIDSPTNGYMAYWEGANNRLNFKQLTVSDISNLSSWLGSTSITTLGVITSGTWNSSIISPTYGGTGVNNGVKTITLGGNLTTSGAFATTFTVTADTNVTLPTTGKLTAKYAVDITGNGSATSFTVTHNLGTTDIVTFLKDATTNAKVEAEEVVTNSNVLTVNFNVAPANGKVYRVTVIG